MTMFTYAKSIVKQSATSGSIVEDVFSAELHERLSDIGDCCNSSNFGRYQRADGLWVYVVKSQEKGKSWEIHLVEYV